MSPALVEMSTSFTSLNIYVYRYVRTRYMVGSLRKMTYVLKRLVLTGEATDYSRLYERSVGTGTR